MPQQIPWLRGWLIDIIELLGEAWEQELRQAKRTGRQPKAVSRRESIPTFFGSLMPPLSEFREVLADAMKTAFGDLQSSLDPDDDPPAGQIDFYLLPDRSFIARMRKPPA